MIIVAVVVVVVVVVAATMYVLVQVLKHMIRPLLAAAPGWLHGGAYIVLSALYAAGFPGLYLHMIQQVFNARIENVGESQSCMVSKLLPAAARKSPEWRWQGQDGPAYQIASQELRVLH
eukprot:COSAG05_NODE_6349_length_976_cov_1.335234_2_plen_119_part_00